MPTSAGQVHFKRGELARIVYRNCRTAGLGRLVSLGIMGKAWREYRWGFTIELVVKGESK